MDHEKEEDMYRNLLRQAGVYMEGALQIIQPSRRHAFPEKRYTREPIKEPPPNIKNKEPLSKPTKRLVMRGETTDDKRSNYDKASWGKHGLIRLPNGLFAIPPSWEEADRSKETIRKMRGAIFKLNRIADFLERKNEPAVYGAQIKAHHELIRKIMSLL